MSTAFAVFEHSFVDASVLKVDLTVAVESASLELPIITGLAVGMLLVPVPAALAVLVGAREELVIDELALARLPVPPHVEQTLPMATVLVPVTLVLITVRIVVQTSTLLLTLEYHSRIDVAVPVLDLSPLQILELPLFFGECADHDLSLRVLVHADSACPIGNAPLSLAP